MSWICCFQVFWPISMLSALQMRCVVQPFAAYDNIFVSCLSSTNNYLCCLNTLYSCLAQVVNAWLKCFHVLVPLLDKTLIKGKILPVALAKGANDETSVQSRVICCAMLGSMAACLTKVIAVIIILFVQQTIPMIAVIIVLYCSACVINQSDYIHCPQLPAGFSKPCTTLRASSRLVAVIAVLHCSALCPEENASRCGLPQSSKTCICLCGNPHAGQSAMLNHTCCLVMLLLNVCIWQA